MTRIGSFFFFRLPKDKQWRPTFQLSKRKAEGYIVRLLKRQLSHQSNKLTFGEYADRFFVWNRCPYVKRTYAEGGTVSQHEIQEMREILEKEIVGTPLAEKRLAEIDGEELRRFIQTARRNTGMSQTDKLSKVVCIILHEAYLRVEIRHDPTEGLRF